MRLSILLITLLVAGCGGGPSVATVEGVVRLDGRPIADAEVVFVPDPARGGKGPPASAYTDARGRYRLDPTSKTGAVVGPSCVLIRDASIMAPGGGADADSGVVAPEGVRAPRRSRVHEIYADAARTPFASVEVAPGTQHRDFDLKSRP